MAKQGNYARKTDWQGRFFASLAGVVSAGLLFGVAELFSGFFGPAASPLTSVGATFIDFTPAWMKNFAIATFGTNDKLVLLISLVIGAVILAAVAGLLARKNIMAGASAVVAFAVVMGLCVISRAGADILDLIPLVLGTAAGLWALRLLIRAISTRQGTSAETEQEGQSDLNTGTSRRAFLVRSAALAGVAVVVGLGGRALTSARNTTVAFREALKLPSAKSKAAALPAGVQGPVEGVTPFVTANKDFYRIDTALVPPDVDPTSWSLRVHGMVENEFTMTFDELLAQDLVESYVTLTCVSNIVGGNLAGNAKWLGYPLREVMARAKPKDGADMVLSTSIDGFSASTPLPALQDDREALLAVGMNGEPLPVDHGFPVRMVVPGLYGFVSATKWVVDLEVTTFEQMSGYWTSRGWSSHGPIKTASRVEVPRALARVPAGKVAIGGSAWAQQSGISKVEVQVDNNGWQLATLADEASIDTWRQWSYYWEGATSGTHKVQVRAYNGAGEMQIEKQAPPEPDGSTGWHSITFTVE
ncbi:molybdopterin-dependent oxidoreductase [Arthrobacter psychrochitiniphilus]|uniref:Oxidoreductase n=1 Tax=Arthrobacter psychrochitiniphilus TaxID=291045 RepID=A0A2V3DMZ1_9MICC|nr:molybdopterin-dependent oxidoreductase [Arthrobacter psychrochitiniphilus]NYG18518.1 DMSO/TMAO reductase YedYZ molybdopterin-dependent catalytic subunit [Arthrobacter psychrochitiniphilus]PXA64333.1 oxidoreductase [Arthrobacter psychrochitiniphilus]